MKSKAKKSKTPIVTTTTHKVYYNGTFAGWKVTFFINKKEVSTNFIDADNKNYVYVFETIAKGEDGEIVDNNLEDFLTEHFNVRLNKISYV